MEDVHEICTSAPKYQTDGRTRLQIAWGGVDGAGADPATARDKSQLKKRLAGSALTASCYVPHLRVFNPSKKTSFSDRASDSRAIVTAVDAVELR